MPIGPARMPLMDHLGELRRRLTIVVVSVLAATVFMYFAAPTLVDILSGVEDIAFVELERADVVRHSLVGKIVEAYEAFDAHPHGLNGGQVQIATSGAGGKAAGKARHKGKDDGHVRAHQ